VKSLTAINISGRAKLFIKLLLTGLALSIVLNKISITDTWRALKQVSMWSTLTALLLYNLSQIISALRLRLFLQSIHLSIPHKTNMQLYYRGMFYNLFLPGGIGGDAYKIVVLHKHTNIPVRNIFGALLADRASGAIALLILLLLSLTATPVLPPVGQYLPLPAALLIFLTSTFIIRLISRSIQMAWNAAMAYSLTIQLIQAAASIVLFAGLGIPDDHLPLYTATFFASSLTAAIPLTIGGAGARELTFVWASSLFPEILRSEQAIAFTTIFFLINVLSALMGVFLKSNLEEKRASVPYPAGQTAEP
jgi:uncharacterized membrane protein YbhN (UPF0104 family)